VGDDEMLVLHPSARGVEQWWSRAHAAFEAREPIEVAAGRLHLVSTGTTVDLVWAEATEEGGTQLLRRPLASAGPPQVLSTIQARLGDLSVSEDGRYLGLWATRDDRSVFSMLAEWVGDRLIELERVEGRRVTDLSVASRAGGGAVFASSAYDHVFGLRLFVHLADATGRVAGSEVKSDWSCRLEPRFSSLRDTFGVAWLEQGTENHVFGQVFRFSGEAASAPLMIRGPGLDSTLQTVAMGRGWMSSIHLVYSSPQSRIVLRSSEVELARGDLSGPVSARPVEPSAHSDESGSLVVWFGNDGLDAPTALMASRLESNGRLAGTLEITTLRQPRSWENLKPAVSRSGERWWVVWQDLAAGSEERLAFWGAEVMPDGQVDLRGQLATVDELVQQVVLAATDGRGLLVRKTVDGSFRRSIDGLRLDAEGRAVGAPFPLLEGNLEVSVRADEAGFDVAGAGWNPSRLQGVRLSAEGDVRTRWELPLDGVAEDVHVLGRRGDQLFLGASRSSGAPGRDVTLRLLRVDFGPSEPADGGQGDAEPSDLPVGPDSGAGPGLRGSDGCGCTASAASGPHPMVWLVLFIAWAGVRTRRSDLWS
jgi:MYXO-CTERM domain-containing protein